MTNDLNEVIAATVEAFRRDRDRPPATSVVQPSGETADQVLARINDNLLTGRISGGIIGRPAHGRTISGRADRDKRRAIIMGAGVAHASPRPPGMTEEKSMSVRDILVGSLAFSLLATAGPVAAKEVSIKGHSASQVKKTCNGLYLGPTKSKSPNGSYGCINEDGSGIYCGGDTTAQKKDLHYISRPRT